jgi:hypothetical protein
MLFATEELQLAEQTYVNSIANAVIMLTGWSTKFAKPREAVSVVS